MADQRPFHETIVDSIKAARHAADMEVLAALIIATKIPANHDQIITAWAEQRDKLGLVGAWGVRASVAEQKPKAMTRDEEVAEVLRHD